MNDSRAANIEKFAAQLRQVRADAGQPALSAIAAASEGQGMIALQGSAIAAILDGNRMPSWEFVVGFVTACERCAADRGVPLSAPPEIERLKRLYDSTIEDIGLQDDTPLRAPDASGLLPGFQEDQLADLVNLAASARADTREPPVIVLTGPVGVGKTSLATRAAQTADSDFPDGVFYLSMADPPPRGLPLSDAIAAILSDFSPAHEIPAALPERYSLLREILRSHSILLVIDDVDNASAVSPLLPRPASRSLVIVISRSDLPLPGRRLAIRPAGLAESVAFIRQVAGDDESGEDPGAITDLARQAAGLPLALSLAAQLISETPGGAREAADQVQESGLRGENGIDSIFALTYKLLSPYAATVLRSLACAKSLPMPVDLVPFLLGQEAESAELRAAIAELVRYGLIADEYGLIRVHDLIAVLVRSRAEEEEPDGWLDIIADRGRRISLLAYGQQPQPEPVIIRDFWTTDDQLSHAYYGDAIADFIRHPQTLPPLTIGLKAPWGAGKTSLMRMIQENLDPRDSGKPCRLRLDAGELGKTRARLSGLLKKRRRRDTNAGFTNLDILREVNAADNVPVGELLADEAPADSAPPAAGEPARGPLYAQLADEKMNAAAWRPTVWFNPWMYQSGEQTWAGLANEIISQVTDRLQPVDRELFWIQLNLSRVDPSVIRRRWYSLLVERLVPLIVLWAVTIAVALVSLLIAQLVPPLRDALRYLSDGLSGVGTVALLGGGLVNLVTFLNRRAVGPLSALVRKPDLKSADSFLEGQFKGGFDQLVTDPGYAARLGFLHLVQTDMQRVLKLVATPARPLVIFVDDLDRCSPGTVSQVIEAINLFLAGEFPNCIFVLAMEPSAVALHIEAAYKDLVEAQRGGQSDGEWSTLGWRFLDKIVQLPLTVPGLQSEDDVERYLHSLMKPGKARPRLVAPVPEPPSDVAVPVPRTDQPPLAGARAGAVTDTGSPRDTADFAVVDELEKHIRKRRPSPETIREVALTVQEEMLGEPTPMLPVTLAAASRVFATFYSDADAYDALRDALAFLPSRNPREIKRFVNLFRFYSFIAERGRLMGKSAVSREQIAKIAAFAIRWPSVLSMLTPAPDADGQVVRALEDAARADDPMLWDKVIRKSLPALTLPDAQAEPSADAASSSAELSAQPAAPADQLPSQSRELRRFMREGAEIASVVAQFF